MATETNDAGIGDDHFIYKLAMEVTFDGRSSTGTAPVRPEFFAPGTHRIRTALLATMVDVVAGHAPGGAVGPTVDLRVQVYSPPPSNGHVRLVCHPLRVGSRLIVGETMLHAGDDPVPFAGALTTFINKLVGIDFPERARQTPPMEVASFDDFLGATILDSTSLELAPVLRLGNGLLGTVQGGVQALLAELAAEHALGAGERLAASDLDIRYLDRLRVGPLVAMAEEMASADGRRRARVTLTDGGDGHLVSHVSLTLGPLVPSV